MLKSNSARWAIILCFALMASGCGDDSGPTAPTVVAPPSVVAPVPQPVTLTGIWSGSVVGVLVIGDARAELTQDGTTVAGNWSMPMPLAFIAAGVPADLDLTGPVSGTVTDTTAVLSFRVAGRTRHPGRQYRVRDRRVGHVVRRDDDGSHLDDHRVVPAADSRSRDVELHAPVGADSEGAGLPREVQPVSQWWILFAIRTALSS